MSITDACIGWDATVERAARPRRRRARSAGCRLADASVTRRAATRRRRPPCPPEIELKLAHRAGRGPAQLLRHPALRAARSAARRARARLVVDVLRHRRLRARAARASRCGCGATDGAGCRRSRGRRGRSRRARCVARDEFEMAAGRPGSSIALALAHDARGGARSADALAGGLARPRFTTDFVRTTIPLAFADGTTALLRIDVGEVRDTTARHVGARRSARSRSSSRPATRSTSSDFAAALAADLPLAIQVAGKAERGVALIRRAARWLAGAGACRRADLPPASATPPTRCSRSCASAPRQIDANAAGLLHDDDPEWIHQMRIGTRRLRSCLALARAAAAGARRRRRQRAACASSPTSSAGARPRRVRRLNSLQPLAARRATPTATLVARARAGCGSRADARGARRAPRRARSSARRDFARLVLALGALGSLPRFGVPPAIAADDPLSQPAPRSRRAAAPAPSPRVAHGHGARRTRSASRATRGAHRRQEAALRGRVLRAAVRARQARAQPTRRALAALQDALGQLNDGETAARLVATLTGGRPEHAEAAGAVAGWVAARQVAVVDTLAPAWKAFRRRAAVLARRLNANKTTGRKTSCSNPPKSATASPRATTQRDEPALREALLNAQYDLLRAQARADPGADQRRRGRRSRRDRQPADDLDGPAPHPRVNAFGPRDRRGTRAPARVALLARAAAARARSASS